MAVREDLVASAITFLQDPSVAAAPMEKRVAFLQSKNLTQEEIDASLARAGGAQAQPPPQGYPYPPQQVSRQPPPLPQGYGYGQYPGGYFQQQPPPELPRRDWRDYFIMATVTAGLGYGVYTVAKRYIVPLIAPPTPAQLEQDKASTDEAYARAFDLIEQLSSDITTIKATEEERKEKLDSMQANLDSMVQDMKSDNRRRDEEQRRTGDDVRNLQTLVPKAIKAQEENIESRLKELKAEMQSLKTLLSNRAGGASVLPSTNGVNSLPSTGRSLNDYRASANGSGSTSPLPGTQTPAENGTSAESSERQTQSSSSLLGRPSPRGGIPAWQLAAQKKADDAAQDASATAADASSAQTS